MTRGLFNSANILQYYNYTFITENKSNYHITNEGLITGKEGINGAGIKLIAGIDLEYRDFVITYLNYKLNPQAKTNLDELIRNGGQEIKPGLCILLSFIDESSQQLEKNGLITSPVREIIIPN